MKKRVVVAVFVMAVAANALAQYGETITVSRVIADVRVTKANGEPVTGLRGR